MNINNPLSSPLVCFSLTKRMVNDGDGFFVRKYGPNHFLLSTPNPPHIVQCPFLIVKDSHHKSIPTMKGRVMQKEIVLTSQANFMEWNSFPCTIILASTLHRGG